MAVRDGLQRGIPSMLRERYFADPDAIDCEAVFEAVSHKDRLCLDELRHWTTNLGWLLVSAVHVYSPDVIILSGGATHGPAFSQAAPRAGEQAHLPLSGEATRSDRRL